MITERLGTTDEFGDRVYLYPEEVKGRWRTRRNLFAYFLIFVFMILPWIHVKGQQIILLNIPKREFIIFGTTFFAHDAPFLLFVFLLFVISMGLITSLGGRLWCGWGCPQTVFIHNVYGQIERFIEGGARIRKKRDAGPWTKEKSFRKFFKWLAFLLVSLHLAHSFLGYFVGTRELLMISLQSPLEHLTLFSIMLFFTGLFLFDFGWFKEQFCLIACPYGRFQSVAMDEHSLVVAYDEKRGEPRRSKEISKELEGDCVNCGQCVRACPTGIDIRNGPSQFECIACTQCIDACDDIMARVHKPPGLIKYTSEVELKGEKTKWLRPRIILYFLAFVSVLSLLIFSLQRRAGIDMTLIRVGKDPYQITASQDIILNRYSAKINVHQNGPIIVNFYIEPFNKEKIDIVSSKNDLILETGMNSHQFFIRFPRSILQNGSQSVDIKLIDIKTNEIITTKELHLVGPF